MFLFVINLFSDFAGAPGHNVHVDHGVNYQDEICTRYCDVIEQAEGQIKELPRV